MSWSGGTYTKSNAGTGGWTGDAVAGIAIDATRHDTQDNDFATGINNCLTKDGQNQCTANLNFGGFRPSNVAAGSAAAPSYTAGGDVDTGAYGPAANTYAIATGGIERVRVDSAGLVGIGTAAPNNSLHVNASVGNATIQLTNSTTGTAVTDGFALVSEATTNEAFLINRENAALNFRTNNTQRMVIGAGGLVGINVNPPQVRLHVGGAVPSSVAPATNKGTVQIDEASITALTQDGGLEFKNSAANSGYGSRIVGFDDGTIVIARRQNSATWSESMRIDPIGRVGLNTTVPAYQLHLSTDSAAKPTTNTWTIVSDARIKTNVQDYTKGLDEIKQVRPVTYDYNGLGGNPAGPGGISIIAQEIQPIFPECVGTFSAKLNPEDEQETELLNYNGHAITFALINAVKELAAKVEALEAKVAILEGV